MRGLHVLNGSSAFSSCPVISAIHGSNVFRGPTLIDPPATGAGLASQAGGYVPAGTVLRG